MSVSLAADAMKPDLQRVRTYSKPGFISSRRTGGAQIAVRTVPVLPESGLPGSRTRQTTSYAALAQDRLLVGQFVTD
jgi:hypothetical protein